MTDNRPPSAADGPLLTASGLSVGFSVGGSIVSRLRHEERILRAVDGVDLAIRRGEALALVGESGLGQVDAGPGADRAGAAGRRADALGRPEAGQPTASRTSAGCRWCSRTRTPR